MFRIVIAPVDFVPSEEGSLSSQNVFLSRNNTEISEIIGRV